LILIFSSGIYVIVFSFRLGQAWSSLPECYSGTSRPCQTLEAREGL